MQYFELPSQVRDLVKARNKLLHYYHDVFSRQGSKAKLSFTLDGNLVGDIGEAIAVELFGVNLVAAKSFEGIDGFAPDGTTSLQVKTTATGRGPAFRKTSTSADHLLFFDLDLKQLRGEVVFNGPEHIATARLPAVFTGQRSLTPRQIRAANALVPVDQRLPTVSRI